MPRSAAAPNSCCPPPSPSPTSAARPRSAMWPSVLRVVPGERRLAVGVGSLESPGDDFLAQAHTVLRPDALPAALDQGANVSRGRPAVVDDEIGVGGRNAGAAGAGAFESGPI